MKVGSKVKIIGPCQSSGIKIEDFFPDLTGYITYISDKIIDGKTYVVVYPKETDWGAMGWGFLKENLELIKT